MQKNQGQQFKKSPGSKYNYTSASVLECVVMYKSFCERKEACDCEAAGDWSGHGIYSDLNQSPFLQ